MRGGGGAVARAGEGRNFVAADDAGSVQNADADLTIDASETAMTRTDGGEGSSRDTGPDPWQALVQVGAQFIAALAAANNPGAAAHPWIERDPATGAQSLKIPLPAPQP